MPCFPTRRSSDLLPHGIPKLGDEIPVRLAKRGEMRVAKLAPGIADGRRADVLPAALRALAHLIGGAVRDCRLQRIRSEEHTSELQSLMRISYAVFCLKKKTTTNNVNSN